MINLKRNEITKSGRLYTCLILLVFIVYYFLFAILDGPIIAKDSMSYILMHTSREPFYPIFLAINRALFKEDTYFGVVILLQSALWAYANFSLVDYIRKQFDFKVFFSILSILVCIVPSMFLRFFAARGYMYSTVILTEGICIPLFMLFARFILEYIYINKKSALITSALISFILISSRKQMIITLLLMLIAVIYVSFKNNLQFKKRIKGSLVGILLCVIVMLLNLFLEYGYSYTLHKTFATHSSDDRFFATVVFYVSERQDAENIKDEEARKLFIKIYDICDSEGDMLHSANGTIMQKAQYYAEHYDCIQIDHLWPEVESYVENVLMITDTVSKENYVDKLMSDMTYGVLPKVIPKVIFVFFASFLHGFVNTVATSEITLLHYYAILVALLYIVLLMINIIKKSDKVALIGVYTALSVIFNIGLVSVVIFCQNRYMIYNMSLFYLTLLIMMHEVLKDNKIFRRLL